MSFTVKSLGDDDQARNVESAGEATQLVSELQKQEPGAVKVEIHREEEDANASSSAESAQDQRHSMGA
jgi:hypothetical protein